MDKHPRMNRSRHRFPTRSRCITATARLLLMVWLVAVALPVGMAAAYPSAPLSPAAKQEIHELELRVQAAEQKAAAANTKVIERTEGYQRQIASLETSINRWISTATMWGTILAIFLPLLMVGFAWKSHESAREAAAGVARRWIDEKGQERLDEHLKPLIESAEEKIRRLNPLIESAKKKLGELEDGFESAESLLAEIRRQRDDGHEIVDRLKTTMMDPLSELTDTEHQAVAQAAVLATDKSEGGQSWIDLWTLATDAYGREDFVEAAEYFAQVSEVAPTDTLVAHALLHQGASFAGLGRHEGAIRIFEKVIDRFGDAPDIGLRVLVATATLNKGVMLGKLSRQLDQVAVYDQLIKRFSDSDVPDIRDSVARAFNGKADSLRNIAKTKWVGGDMEAAQQDLTDAIGKLDSALKHNPELFLTLGNLAYTRHLLGEGGDAVRGPLKKALELGGEELYTETIIDIETHPVPEKDEAFRELLDTVWAEVQAEAKTPKGD